MRKSRPFVYSKYSNNCTTVVVVVKGVRLVLAAVLSMCVSTPAEVRQYASSSLSPRMYIQQQTVAKVILPDFRLTQIYVEFGFITYTATSGKGNGLSTLQLMTVAYILRTILTTKPGEIE